MAAPSNNIGFKRSYKGLNNPNDLKQSGLGEMLAGSDFTDYFNAPSKINGKNNPNAFYQWDAGLNTTGGPAQVWKVGSPQQIQTRTFDSKALYSQVMNNISISKQVYSQPTETTATAKVASLLNITGK